MAKRNTTVKEYCPTCRDMVEAVVIDDFENAVCEICGSQTRDIRNTCGGGGSDDYAPTFGTYRIAEDAPTRILTAEERAFLATYVTTSEMKPTTKSRIIVYTVGDEEETTATKPAAPREGGKAEHSTRYDYPGDCDTAALRKAYRARARRAARRA